MRGHTRIFTICLLAGSVTSVMAGQLVDNPPPPHGQTSQPEQRPTLGPRNGPEVLGGPSRATTIDLRKLKRIHTLYIENIDNSLSEKLVEPVGKLGRFRLVTKARDADATLRGTCLESRHLKRVHTEIYISDRNGGSIWQDTIYRPFNPPALDKAVSDTAGLVAAHLEQSFRAADTR